MIAHLREQVRRNRHDDVLPPEAARRAARARLQADDALQDDARVVDLEADIRVRVLSERLRTVNHGERLEVLLVRLQGGGNEWGRSDNGARR